MNAFPAAVDYYKAVQAPAWSFTVEKLQKAEFVWDSLGPTLALGSTAVVFHTIVDGSQQALRCYLRDVSSRDRYSALDTYLAGHDLSPYVSGTTWLDGAITVNRAPWPVLTMDWIDGRTLNEYVDFLVAGSNAAALTTLAGRWRELVALLQRSEFAHGDLQHGNVMVDQDGQLRLVDFNGVWIPQLTGQPPPTEYGHPNYQHPLHHNWDRWLDTFSALVIYLSLVALARDPGLWLALYNSKNLLFAKTDFFPPFTTEAWKQLAALRDPQVDELARKLQERCNPLWVSNRSLEATLEQPAAAPALPAVPADHRWWEKPARAPGGGASGVGAARPAAAVRAARYGEHRTDAAAEPPDGAARRHHLVDPAAGRRGPGSGRTRIPGIPRVRAGPTHAPGVPPHAPVPTPPGPPVPGRFRRYRHKRGQPRGLRERRPVPDQQRPRLPAMQQQQGAGSVVYDNLVRRAFAETVHPGQLLFNPPDRMRLGQTERVEVRLTRTLTLGGELLERLRGRGEPQLEEIPTAPLMAVTLRGDGFQITAYSHEEQIVTQEGVTTWEFDIRALKRGQQRLVMCVSLRIPVAGQPLEHKSIPVREATIDVQIGAPALVAHLVSDNWQWFHCYRDRGRRRPCSGVTSTAQTLVRTHNTQASGVASLGQGSF